ncbi:excinuclease ABC subunit UvrC [Patescibacteria group bacterium]|nr:MAG: excinuclease ABC subunit UvrC [Patescibacteria group bacterium]
MSIPDRVQLPAGGLPEKPGVYLMRDAGGRVIYVGKATSLKRRVTSYWRIQEQISRYQVADLIAAVDRIEVQPTRNVLEALILEANLIKKHLPKYNIMQKDDKSFLYLAISNDPYPKPLFVRGHELEREGKRRYKAVFGPYLQPAALRAALKLVRKFIPWSTCEPPPTSPLVKGGPRGVRGRPCFDYHIGACPGVCVGAISKRDYAKIIRRLILFFEGKTERVERALERDMKKAAAEERYEDAEKAKRQLYALRHINDIAVLSRDEGGMFGHPRQHDLPINIFGRIEGYDISNISGTSAVGSMVVFEDGEPKKSEYRKFKIKTVKGANDYAMLAEVLRRRFARATAVGADRRVGPGAHIGAPLQDGWALPDLIMIDGGWGQVNIAKEILREKKLTIPVVGIAKGFDRKQDRLIYPKDALELGRVVEQYKVILQRLRDEAHRFAIGYHRKLRGKRT